MQAKHSTPSKTVKHRKSSKQPGNKHRDHQEHQNNLLKPWKELFRRQGSTAKASNHSKTQKPVLKQDILIDVFYQSDHQRLSNTANPLKGKAANLQAKLSKA